MTNTDAPSSAPVSSSAAQTNPAQCAHVSKAEFDIVVTDHDTLTDRVAQLEDYLVALKIELDKLKAES